MNSVLKRKGFRPCARRSWQEHDAVESEAAEIQAEIEDKEQVAQSKQLTILMQPSSVLSFVCGVRCSSTNG